MFRLRSQFALLLLAGCTVGTTSEPYPARVVVAPPPPLPEVAELTFAIARPAVVNRFAVELHETLQRNLVAAGYRVDDRPDAHPDVLLVPTALIARESGLVQLSINGQVPRRVRVFLTADGHAGVIDRFHVDFSSAGGVRSEDVAPLVRELGRSLRLAAYQRHAAVAAAEERNVERQREEADAARQARVAEEEDWNRARAVACSIPTTLAACDGARLYLARYPDGVHADEAKAALAEGEPKLVALQKDDAAWAQSGAGACRNHADAHACDGVDLYLIKFPAGMHADEARSIKEEEPNQ